MLIKIKRYYVGSDIEQEVLINTRYIYRVEPVKPDDKHYDICCTRILFDSGVSRGDDRLDIVYTNDTIPTILGKVTRQRKKNLEEE